MRVAVFDLDGTLVDTAPDLVAAVQRAAANEAGLDLPAEVLRPMIGFGVTAMLKTGLAHLNLAPESHDIPALQRASFDAYAGHEADTSRPFPGVIDELEALKEEGWKLAVCTGKPKRFSLPLLSALDMMRLFDAVVSGDSYEKGKPDPMPLLGAISETDADLTQAVMVGDSRPDILAARAAGVPIIAVDFGYSDVPIRSLGADRVISHYNELKATIHSLSV